MDGTHDQTRGPSRMFRIIVLKAIAEGDLVKGFGIFDPGILFSDLPL
jgi:hypothetical protein